MLTWETTVEAQALYARGWTKSAIARHLGINRRTVRDYLKGQQVPGQRVRSEPEVLPRSPSTPGCGWPTTRICGPALFDELTALGYAGSYPAFTRALRMRRLRPHCEPCAASRGRDAGMLFIGPQAATPAAVANAVARTRSSPSWTWAGGRANSVLSLGGRAWQVTYIDWKMLGVRLLWCEAGAVCDLGFCAGLDCLKGPSPLRSWVLGPERGKGAVPGVCAAARGTRQGCSAGPGSCSSRCWRAGGPRPCRVLYHIW